MHYIYYI